MSFRIGQRVVYPSHGIGTIEQIEQKQIGNEVVPFYTLRLAATNSVVLVPVHNAVEVGLRTPITVAECELLLKNLGDDFDQPPTDWKDRFKEFSDKMRSGCVFDASSVLKNLTYLSHIKPLSFREQRMFEKSRYLVVSELAAVFRQAEAKVAPRIDDALARACAKHTRASTRAHAATTVH